MQSAAIEDRQLQNLGKAVGVIGSEERASLIWLIGTDRKRFSDLLRFLPDTGVQDVSSTLQTLETEGVVLKSVEEGTPRKTFYSLTGKGKALLPVLSNLVEWAELDADADEEQIETVQAEEDDTEFAEQTEAEEIQESEIESKGDEHDELIEIIEDDEDEEIVIEGRTPQADAPQFHAGGTQEPEEPDAGEHETGEKDEKSLHNWINRKGQPGEPDTDGDTGAADQPETAGEPHGADKKENEKESLIGKMKSASMFSSLNKWGEKHRGKPDEDTSEDDSPADQG